MKLLLIAFFLSNIEATRLAHRADVGLRASKVCQISEQGGEDPMVLSVPLGKRCSLAMNCNFFQFSQKSQPGKFSLSKSFLKKEERGIANITKCVCKFADDGRELLRYHVDQWTPCSERRCWLKYTDFLAQFRNSRSLHSGNQWGFTCSTGPATSSGVSTVAELIATLDGTSSKLDDARKALWEKLIIPDLEDIASAGKAVPGSVNKDGKTPQLTKPERTTVFGGEPDLEETTDKSVDEDETGSGGKTSELATPEAEDDGATASSDDDSSLGDADEASELAQPEATTQEEETTEKSGDDGEGGSDSKTPELSKPEANDNGVAASSDDDSSLGDADETSELAQPEVTTQEERAQITAKAVAKLDKSITLQDQIEVRLAQLLALVQQLQQQLPNKDEARSTLNRALSRMVETVEMLSNDAAHSMALDVLTDLPELLTVQQVGENVKAAMEYQRTSKHKLETMVVDFGQLKGLILMGSEPVLFRDITDGCLINAAVLKVVFSESRRSLDNAKQALEALR